MEGNRIPGGVSDQEQESLLAQRFCDLIKDIVKHPRTLDKVNDLDEMRKNIDIVKNHIEDYAEDPVSFLTKKHPRTEPFTTEDTSIRPTKKPRTSVEANLSVQAAGSVTKPRALTKNCSADDLDTCRERVKQALLNAVDEKDTRLFTSRPPEDPTIVSNYWFNRMVKGAVNQINDFVESYHSEKEPDEEGDIEEGQDTASRALDLAADPNVPVSVSHFYTKLAVRCALAMPIDGTERKDRTIDRVERILAEIELFKKYEQLTSDLGHSTLGPQLTKYFMDKGVPIDKDKLKGSASKNAATIARSALAKLLSIERKVLKRLHDNIRSMDIAINRMGPGLAFVLPYGCISNFARLGVKRIEKICQVVEIECPEWLVLFRLIEKHIATPFLEHKSELNLTPGDWDTRKDLSIAEVLEAMATPET